jgi:L-alanine-DL-glutamate epimerase-like enolase superfamily enzyme
MKIDDVNLTLFTWDGLPAVVFGPNVRQAGGTSLLGLLAIRTDDGITGHAFLGASGRSAATDAGFLVQGLKPLLMGQDPRDRERLHRAMAPRARTSVRALGAVDVALWDIAGKAAGLPIHQLLGTYKRSMKAYASSPAHPTVEAYCEEALAWKERGVGAYKLHIPGEPRRDIAICTAVRKAVGDDHVLMIDAGFSYDYPQALKVGRAIEELGFLWYEDPMGEWSIPNYVKLKAKLDVPIMATELPFLGFEMYAPWVFSQATDYLRGDVAFKGGITPMVKTAHLAEAFGMNYEIHHGSNSLNNVAGLHVAMAVKNSEYFEYLLPEAIIRYGLIEDIEIDREGMVHAPTEPGLGVAIDFEMIERKKTAVLE